MDLARIREGSYLQLISPRVAEELHSMARRCEQKAYRALAVGDLSPLRALELWVEHKALYDMERRLAQRIREGQAAGETMKEM